MPLNSRDYAAGTLLLAACFYAWLKPIWDWDVIAYWALAKSLSGWGWGDIHAWVYAVVDGLPEWWRLDLMNRDVYRAAVASDPEALRQNVQFYQARVGYYGLLAGLMKLGLSAVTAVQVLCLVGQLLLGGVMWLWLRISGARGQVLGWLLLIGYAFLLFNPTVMKLGRWSSPDGLVAGLLVMGFYLLLKGKGSWWALAWLGMVLLRPNAVLWLAPVGVWALLYWRTGGLRVAMPLLGLAGLALGMMLVWPNHPLAVLWQHSFVGPYTHPTEGLGIAKDQYWPILKTRVLALHGRDLVVWAVMALAVAGLWLRRPPAIAWLGMALFAGCCLQILMFPAFWERYYGGACVALVLMAVAGIPREKTATCNALK